MVKEVGRPQSSLKHTMILRRDICGVLGEKELGEKELGDENCVNLSDSLYAQKSRTLYILFSTENCAGDEDPS